MFNVKTYDLCLQVLDLCNREVGKVKQIEDLVSIVNKIEFEGKVTDVKILISVKLIICFLLISINMKQLKVKFPSLYVKRV